MKELDELKAAFEQWMEKTFAIEEQYSADKTADLFWPFLEMYFNRRADPKSGVSMDEMRAFYKFKEQLGMELWAHEK